MVRPLWIAVVLAMIANSAAAQEYYGDVGSQPYLGAGSVGSQEPLFPYDDQEPWKHGYQQYIPFYGGYHYGRPYNYHHVFAQTQTSVGWGMPHGMPYSQQWWHRFDSMGDPGRAMTEPNGYMGYVPPKVQNQGWAQVRPAAAMPVYTMPTGPIAPVQYQLPIAAPGVDPSTAPMQTRQLQQYLAAPGAY